MTCIACGSVSEFRCTIKDVTVCLCKDHIDKDGHYDCIVPEAS